MSIEEAAIHVFLFSGIETVHLCFAKRLSEHQNEGIENTEKTIIKKWERWKITVNCALTSLSFWQFLKNKKEGVKSESADKPDYLIWGTKC